MADNYHAASAAVEQAPSHGLGLVEPGHGAGPLVRPDGIECHRGGGGGTEREHDTATLARGVLRGPSQTGHPAASPPGRDLFCAAAGLDRELVAGDPTGRGARYD